MLWIFNLKLASMFTTCLQAYLKLRGWLSATSHTSLKALDHGNVRALIGEKAETVQDHFTLGGEGLKAPKKFVDEKSTRSPTWRIMDKGAWSTGICVRPTSKRWV
jgi:hypothetical protein